MKLTKAKLRQIIKEVLGEVQAGALPQDLLTVGQLIKALSGLPDDMPVGMSHEFGIVDAGKVRTVDNKIYKDEDYGGDWHDEEDLGDAPGAPRHTIVLIGGVG